MRFFNKDNELKVYAVSGTQTVLLAMDLPKTKSVGKKFMGFKISRQIGNYKTVLNGTKRFASDDPDHPIQPLSPLQTFLWKDYTVDPNKTYKYKFEAMFGSWDNMSPKYEAELTVKTEPLVSGEHSVFFNFGVTGSQAYAKKFDKKKVELLPKADKEKAFDILGRELFKDGLLKFVKQAKNSRFKLLSAFYELEYPPFLNALKDAQNKGAEIQLVYSARPTQKAINEAEIKNAGLEDVSIGRSYQVAQPHNKFMLLIEDGKPTQVWTGSTNITIRGIFGHSNTGHWIKNEAIAKKYYDYWKLLSTNPKKSDLNTLTEKLQIDINGSRLHKGTKVIFSPRKTDVMLAEYVKIMDKAKDAVCIIYPFNIEKIFKDFYSNKRDLNRAIEIAVEAHKGQKDRVGQSYYRHVFRVMERGKSDEEKICGILHDVVEDTDWTFEALEKEGFSKQIIDALRCVTKESEDEDYDHFTERVSKNPLAIRVKINDLLDNMDISRYNRLTERDLVRLNKYLKAYHFLTGLNS